MFKYLLAACTMCMFFLLGLNLLSVIDADRSSLVWVTVLLLGGTVWRFRAKPNKGTDFMDWALQNRAAILAGTANYRGMAITPATQMVQYRGIVSAVALTVVAPTDHYVVGSPAAMRMRIASTAFSAVLGWWGFPWGVIRTPIVIYGNLTDEYRIVVPELLQEG